MVRKELVGVDQADALKKLLNSDEEDEEEKEKEEEEDEEDKKEGEDKEEKDKKKKKKKKKKEKKAEVKEGKFLTLDENLDRHKIIIIDINNNRNTTNKEI